YIDSNLKDQPALSFFGQNSHQSGYFAARMMMLLAGGEREIVIFRKINEGIVGSNQQERREIGFREYMLKHHSDCRIWELNLHAKRDSDDAQMLNDFFRKHPNVKNGITFNSKVYIVGEYLLKQQKTDFKLMGYDLLERNVKCLMEGSVSFLIAQQPELQGFDGIKALCDYLIFKKEVPRENFMPIDLLTKENIEFYSNK
ncbi:substrate-binding domain-containing protein, partial [Bacteroides cellulosilyticus]